MVGCELVVEGKAPLRILGETAYPAIAASARVRVANYVSRLQGHGISLHYAPRLTDVEYELVSSGAPAASKAAVMMRSAGRTAARRRTMWDLTLVHRLRLLGAVPGLDPPRHLDVYDLDDALFLGSPAAVNRRFQWAKQEARRCIACLRKARLVTAGNAYLASHSRAYAARVELLPTCVDPEIQPLHVHHPSEVVTAGWIGSHTTVPYLEPVLSALYRLNRDRLRVRLVVVGGDTGLREPWIEHKSWSLEREADVLASFDIGLMPLPATEWARGKCGYKLLQYFAAGVPAVASPVGLNTALVGQERGILATSGDEWALALRELAEDVEGRQQRGAAARDFVEADYSYRRWAPELAGLLHSLSG